MTAPDCETLICAAPSNDACTLSSTLDGRSRQSETDRIQRHSHDDAAARIDQVPTVQRIGGAFHL